MTRKRKTAGPRKGSITAQVYVNDYGEAEVSAGATGLTVCPRWAEKLFPGLKMNDGYMETQYTITATPYKKPRAKGHRAKGRRAAHRPAPEATILIGRQVRTLQPNTRLEALVGL